MTKVWSEFEKSFSDPATLKKSHSFVTKAYPFFCYDNMNHLNDEKECEDGKIVGHGPHVEGVVGQAAGGGQEEGGGVDQAQPHHHRPDQQHAHTIHQARNIYIVLFGKVVE